MRRCALVFVLAALGAGAVSRPAAAEAPYGPYKLDVAFGPSIGVFDLVNTQFRLEPSFGINLTPLSRNHIYLDFPLGLGFGSGTTLAIMPGVEGDILLPVGQPLYVYPKGGLGVGLFFPQGKGDSIVAFGLRFGMGVKYVLAGQWNFFFEPFNLEIYPRATSVGSFSFTFGYYNLMFGAGVNL